MAEEKRFARATWQIMEQLLEVDKLEDALSGSLETIVKTVQAGLTWAPKVFLKKGSSSFSLPSGSFALSPSLKPLSSIFFMLCNNNFMASCDEVAG